MNYGLPDFQQREDDYADINHLSGFPTNKKPAATSNEGEIMELLWQNGHLVVQKPSTKIITSPFVGGSGGGDAAIPEELPVVKEPHNFFMQEDEMGPWLHYPVEDSSLNYGDLFCSAPPAIAPTPPVPEIRPPQLMVQKPPQSSTRIQNFGNFSRNFPSYRPRIDSISNPPPPTIAGDYTEGESNEISMVARESRVSRTAPTKIELAAVTRDLTATTSSPGRSGTSFSCSADTRSATLKQDPPPAVDRKRKDREADDNECRSEDVEFESPEGKRHGRKTSTSTKRSRAAEVHNQSERRRRDRINEKMRALQELIPRCNKSDKASMLDEAIEYLKSLQMQVQMMSMGCGMFPMMYPGMQQYMPGMAMGMGIGMDIGMTRPMVPYPSMFPVPACSAMPNTAAVSHMGPRFPIPGFHLPHDHSRTQPSNHHDPMLNSLLVHNANHPSVQNFVDPCHQVLGLHQSQLPLPQNEAMVQHDAKPSTTKEVGNTERKQPGRK